MRMGAEEGSPSLAPLAATQLRCIATEGLAGARGDFGGIGPQFTSLAIIARVAVASNQDAAAKLGEAKNGKWRQLARGAGDLFEMTQQLMKQQLITRE